MVGTPLVTADAIVVAADLVVRFDPRPPSNHPLERGHAAEASWSAVDERIAEAVVVTVLRLHAEESTADELLADRTGLASVVERALRVAPAPVWYDARVVDVEVARSSGAPESGLSFHVL